MNTTQILSPTHPLLEPFLFNRRDEVPGCPTGLGQPPEDPVNEEPPPVPLGVEKLEGRQEAGRDAQDEAEEDEPADT